MQQVRFSDEVNEAFREAVAAKGVGLGEERYAVGGRPWGGSWRALLTSLAVALLIGGLTTWGVVAVWSEPDIPFPVILACSLLYLLALWLLYAAWDRRPSHQHPATWVIAADEGLGWLRQGGTPVLLLWDEIAEARHVVASVRDQWNKESGRTHRLTVVPVAAPAHQDRLHLEPGFPLLEELATFVTARVPAH